MSLAASAFHPWLTARLIEERRQHALLSSPHLRGSSVAVIGVEPQAGRSTVAALLAQVLVRHRGERILAVDTDMHGAGLRRRLATGAGSPVQEVLIGLGIRSAQPDLPAYRQVGYRWLRRHLTPAEGPLLLAAAEPVASELMTASEYVATISTLTRWFPVTVTDTPAGLADPLVASVIAAADHVIIVGSTTNAGLNGASTGLVTVAQLVSRPAQGRVMCALVESPKGCTSRPDDVERRLGVPVVLLPRDRALERPEGLVLDSTTRRTGDAVAALATLLAKQVISSRNRGNNQRLRTNGPAVARYPTPMIRRSDGFKVLDH